MVTIRTPGSPAHEDGTFVVRGSGTDLTINNQGVTGQFVRQPVTGDCEVTARLVSRSGAAGDRVGLLMAKSPSPFDQAAGAIVTGGTSAQLMLRTMGRRKVHLHGQRGGHRPLSAATEACRDELRRVRLHQ